MGLTVGSFTSVSLDPPLVAFLPSSASSRWPKLRQAKSFCVNILAADQEWVCRAFAARGVDKFEGLSWRPSASGSPILEGAVAWVECELNAVHEAGDHLIVLGLVKDLEIERTTLPLLFFQGGYGRFHSHSLAVRDTRFGLQLQLLDRARPLMEAVSERVGARLRRRTVTALSSCCWQVPEPPPNRTRPRARGYGLGLRSVQTEVGMMMDSRPDLHGAPTVDVRESIRRLAPDPLDFVPPGDPSSASPARREDVVSLWAPVFTPDGQIALGLGLVGLPRSEHPNAHAADPRALSTDVTKLLAA